VAARGRGSAITISLVLNAFPDGGLPGFPELSCRRATPTDVGWIAELRADVLRESLERLGRYDPQRVRERLLRGFRAERTLVLLHKEQPVGSLALRREDADTWLEHFYLATAVQGRGVGAGLLSRLTARADALGEALRLSVLRLSPAQRLYARHGFTVDGTDEVDVFMSRRPLGSSADCTDQRVK
jgi:GNAT superfamily N-acetyltransferase